ncbi:hypothetical protein A3A37_02820 [Candidatus Kaiserbacteria bacterium RIFCSPLOWO2_01_FULL_52_36]|nr:MAG: hypothetical protein A3A37_02820 [Candidatus Kaiserbacteria bacterium RIFCSPLOWO2_01_FULL_52_36]
MARQVEARQQLGELCIERFLADVFPRTRTALFGTPIVNVSVDVSIFLIFKFLLASDCTTTLSTLQQSAKCLWLFGRFLHFAAQGKNFLHSVKKLFGDNRRMLPLIHFTRVAKVAVVKRIRENEFCLVFFERPEAAIFPPLCCFGGNAVFKQKT